MVSQPGKVLGHANSISSERQPTSGAAFLNQPSGPAIDSQVRDLAQGMAPFCPIALIMGKRSLLLRLAAAVALESVGTSVVDPTKADTNRVCL